jgi:hypothetical protein
VLAGVLLAGSWLEPTPPACAGAWTREAGSWFGKIGLDRWFTDERFDEHGNRVPYQETQPGFDDTDEYRNVALRAYGEYGITDEWTVTGSTSFEIIEAEGNGVETRTTGFSDLRFQVKRLLVPGPVVISTFVELKTPTGYDEASFPALGSGLSDVAVSLAAGASSNLGYATMETGFVSRGGDYANEIPLNLEVAWAARRDLFVRTEWRALLPVTDPVAQGPVFDPRQASSRSLMGGLSVVLVGDVVDIVLGFDQAISGRNTLAGTRYNLAVWWDR